MKRVYRLPESASLQRKESHGSNWLLVDFRDSEIAIWILELSLLSLKLITELVILSNDSKYKLVLEIDPKLPVNARAESKWIKQGLHMTLTSTELEYWKEFFLIYYRDGEAPVDHIDVEPSGGDQVSLVLKVGRFAPPLSPEDARRSLGM